MKRFIKDCYTMYGRCMKLGWRNPETLVMAVILPVLLLVLFTYLFGGAMYGGHFDTTYINFVFVGIMAVAICQGAMTQATVVCADASKGVLDRFISMPISRSSFIVGHVLAAATRTLIAVVLLFAVGFAMGFRPDANVGQWFGAIAIILGFILAMSWLGVMFGLLCKTVEGSAGVPMLAQILVFLSSAFVPTVTMVAAFRYFANYQPITPIIDTLRYLFLGIGEARTLEALLWIGGLVIVGFAMSVWAFKRKIRK
ncbi:MAG: ABC transporter permease [Firmicutes bacterium]|nr:ABC transporter permease [Bacillota bacterium]